MASTLDELCINTLRFLSVDMVQKANSGHPGLPLGAAPMAYVLWTRRLKHDPAHPLWPDRDRFVLSAGHGSALLYSLLHMTGYALSLDDIEHFRQWGSKAPGHPERGHTEGVEITTGPLGQGLGNAVGMAIAEAHLAARYNRDGHPLFDHRTWAIVSDGDLMEGVAAEAAYLAGRLRLGKLACLYDNNSVSLAAGTDITFSEDRARRFEAYGWQTVAVDDGNDIEAIDAALKTAEAETERPTLVLVRTHLGFGSPEQDSFKAHGSPLGVDDVKKTKEKLGWPLEPAFFVPDAAREHFRAALQRGGDAERDWSARRAAWAKAFPSSAASSSCACAASFPRAGTARCRPPRRCQGHGDPRRRRQGDECDRRRGAGALRRLGRPRSVDAHRTQGPGRLQPASVRRRGQRGLGQRGWSYAGRNVHFGVRGHAIGAIVTYQWKEIYGIGFLYAGPLFTHQMSHYSGATFAAFATATCARSATATISRTAAGRR